MENLINFLISSLPIPAVSEQSIVVLFIWKTLLGTLVKPVVSQMTPDMVRALKISRVFLVNPIPFNLWLTTMDHYGPTQTSILTTTDLPKLHFSPLRTTTDLPKLHFSPLWTTTDLPKLQFLTTKDPPKLHFWALRTTTDHYGQT